MLYINAQLPKLCFAKPGDVIRLCNSETGEPEGAPLLVAALSEKGRRAARPSASNGLYDDQRELFMVNLETGELLRLPHLSTRMQRVQNIAIVEGGLIKC